MNKTSEIPQMFFKTTFFLEKAIFIIVKYEFIYGVN